jgi:hypothetical protein
VTKKGRDRLEKDKRIGRKKMVMGEEGKNKEKGRERIKKRRRERGEKEKRK